MSTESYNKKIIEIIKYNHRGHLDDTITEEDYMETLTDCAKDILNIDTGFVVDEKCEPLGKSYGKPYLQEKCCPFYCGKCPNLKITENKEVVRYKCLTDGTITRPLTVEEMMEVFGKLYGLYEYLMMHYEGKVGGQIATDAITINGGRVRRKD
jgi:hypothetical protein